MPRGDGTGPLGAGARTGRGFGNCDGEQTPAQRPGFGRGVGRGLACRRGFGRGFGRGAAFDQTSSKTQKELLKERKTVLQDQLDSIDKQLENL